MHAGYFFTFPFFGALTLRSIGFIHSGYFFTFPFLGTLHQFCSFTRLITEMKLWILFSAFRLDSIAVTAVGTAHWHCAHAAALVTPIIFIIIDTAACLHSHHHPLAHDLVHAVAAEVRIRFGIYVWEWVCCVAVLVQLLFFVFLLFCVLRMYRWQSFSCLMLGETYHKWFRLSSLCPCDIFQILINSFCWFWCFCVFICVYVMPVFKKEW